MAKTPEEELAGLLVQERSKTPEEAYVDLCKAQLAGFPRQQTQAHGIEWSPPEYGVLDGTIFDSSDGKPDASDEVDVLRAKVHLLEERYDRLMGEVSEDRWVAIRAARAKRWEERQAAFQATQDPPDNG
jgi:hypothetical protein